MDETKKMHKGFKIFLLILLSLILFFIRIDKQNIILSIFNKDTSMDKILNMEKVYNGNNLNFFNSELINWENNMLTFINEDGSNKWVKEIDFTEPQLSYGKEHLYILDKSTGDIFQINSSGDTTLRLQLKKPIFNLKESNKNIIIHYKDSSGEHLDFLNNKGKKINSLSTEERILTYSMKEDNSEYVYSTIELKNSGINSMVFINTFENKNEYMIDIPNEIVIYTEFVNDGIIVVTDFGINYLKSNHIEWSKKLKLIRDFHISDNKIFILYENKLEILDFNGKILNEHSYKEGYEKIIIINDYTVLYGNKELLILQEDKEVLKYTTEDVIKKISGDNSNMVIYYEDGLEVYTIK